MGSCCSCNEKDRQKAMEEDKRLAQVSAEKASAPPPNDEAVASVLRALKYKNSDDEEMTFASHRPLEADRATTMSSAFPEVSAPGLKPYAVVAKRGEDVKEFIVMVKSSDPASGEPKIVMGSCSITYEDLSASDCIEYAFPEDPSLWRMTQLSQDALENYRGMKFEAWKGMLTGPTCEAQFRRMLQIGMISKLFDPQVFPTAEDQKAKYQVTDERTGKLIELPHPVQGLRIWDAKAQRYKEIETQLTGAPSESEAAKWWDGFVKELSEKNGAEYIQGLMNGK